MAENKEIDDGLYSDEEDEDDDELDEEELEEFVELIRKYHKNMSRDELSKLADKVNNLIENLKNKSTQSILPPYSSKSLYTSLNPITS
jgi:uncharacterized protein YcbK (DUF882 family)